MRGQVYVIFCLFLACSVGQNMNIGDECTSPDGESGKCVRLGDCSTYSGLLTERPVPVGILNYLKRAKCGTWERKGLFCCPKQGILNKQTEEGFDTRCQTPSGGNGKCLAKSECTAFSALAVSSPLLEQSRCGPGNTERYCCPPQEYSANNNNHANVELLDSETCGPVSNINLADGSRSELYPWVALIAYSGGAAPYRCTGSLINKRFVLTAAHCLKYLRRNVRPVSVRLGELNLETPVDCTDEECLPRPQDVDIERTFIHPQYKGWPNYEHDIALLRLAKDVNLNTQYVKPVCLPVGKAHETKDLVGEELIVSGWCSYESKETPVPLKKQVKGLSHKECSSKLKNEILISSDNQLCTSSEKNSNCEGYGGSPLVKYENGPHRTAAVQYGIASFGPKQCSNFEIPSVYTRVSQYSGWILDQMT